MSGSAIWAGGAALVSSADGNCRVWARGYATDPDGAVHLGDAIGRYLAKHRDRLVTAAAGLNGCFSAVLEEAGEIRVLTDRYGTVPVYIGRTRSGSTACSDDAWRVIEIMASEPEINRLALVDLLHAGYVIGDKTLIDGIKTAAPAAMTTLAGENVKHQRYWSYAYAPEPMESPDAVDRLEGMLHEVTSRSNAVLRTMGARPVLTLSGGLDSRLLAGLFAGSAGGARPAAISYGMADDPEVAVAAEIADALSIDFQSVPVDASYFSASFLDRSVREVGLTTRFTCGTGARHLTCSAGDVLVPGHTGDFVSGGHLPPHAGLVGNRDQLHRFLDLRHFRYPNSSSLLRRVLTVDPRTRFDSLVRTTAGFDFGRDLLGLIDRWNVENRQRRLILMELRAYERAAPWILPFYDYALVDFFARIPHCLRIGQRLYVQTALERIFTGGAAALAKIRRVGKPLGVDRKAHGRLTAFRRVPVVLRSPLLAAWPIARGLQARLRRPQMMTVGPDPIRYWFRSDPNVRAFLTEQMRAISLDGVDGDQLVALSERGDVPEEFFHRLVTSAITAQSAVNMAIARWRGRQE